MIYQSLWDITRLQTLSPLIFSCLAVIDYLTTFEFTWSLWCDKIVRCFENKIIDFGYFCLINYRHYNIGWSTRLIDLLILVNVVAFICWGWECNRVRYVSIVKWIGSRFLIIRPTINTHRHIRVWAFWARLIIVEYSSIVVNTAKF